MLITRLLLVQEVWDGKLTYGKSWTGNRLMQSNLTLDPSLKVKRGHPNLVLVLEVWESSGVVGLVGATNLKI